ncbi:hypothetical protein SAMN05216588_11649 [Pseudomonas flavescens]|uniref:Uncharacterized protein n=1 Tax=Phytopseudomonas flavescens TaxID=29435 RepID=A0A1G8KA44_9GAMM|nr:hypothetical protein [Pseudomonas flavescens]SDI40291.1 hypothetical protein SAMN05216588_11649 [Pseudomonas flavescens]
MALVKDRSLARAGWLLLSLCVVLALAVDLHGYAGQPRQALRTLEPVSAEDQGRGGSVDAFCGFAPCGMPLECDPA